MPASYDHEIEIDGIKKGLTLVRDDKGSAMYSVTEEVPRYDPQLKLMMKNWIGGHGQYEFLAPDIYFDGQSIDTTQDGKITLGPQITTVGIAGGTPALDGNPVYFCWFSVISKLMMATTHKVYWYDDTNWVAKWDASAIGDIVDMAEFNGYLFIALGTGAAYYYTNNGTSYTACTLSAQANDHHASKFFVAPNAAGTANVLWKAITPNEISSNTSGIIGGAAWESTSYIGDTSANITNIFLINDNLMIGRTDNLYHYDSDGGIHALMDSLKANKSTNNFKYVCEWQTAVYFSLGTGMGEIASYNAYDPMGPLSNIGDIGKAGACVGLASDKDWLYVAMDEGTNTHIYKGREIKRGDALRWEWCPWVFIGTNASATMQVVQHSATDRRLWFGYGTQTGYVILTDNPTTDTAARFAPSGFARFSWYYGNNPYWDKMFQSVVLETKGCAAGISVTPKYRKDVTTSMTSVTTSPIVTNGVQKVDFDTAQSCKRIQFELDLASGTNTITPEVTYFEARGTERPETVRIHQAYYAVGDTLARKTTTVRDFLRAGRASTLLIKFADLRYNESIDSGKYTWCVMLPGNPEEVEIIHEKGRTPELALKCRLMEINFEITEEKSTHGVGYHREN